MWPSFVRHYVKNIRGKEYWYLQDTLRINNRITPVSIYVGPKELSDIELREAILVAVQKLINRINELHFNEQKRNYHYKHLTKLQAECLETLRFDYSFRFRKLYPSAFKRYKDSVYVRYVQGTTAIEGNTFSLAETKQVFEDDVTVANKTLREQFEIQNYKKVREFVEETSFRFDLSFIRKLHALVCANIPECIPGKFRVAPVKITSMDVKTSSPSEIETDLEDLIHWYKEQRKNKRHVIEITSIFHQRFEEIHPFTDGNGRVGREIINVLLERADYPPLYFEKTDRAEYITALAAGNEIDDRQANHGPLISLIVKKLTDNHAKILDQIRDLDLSNAEGIGEQNELQKTLLDF